MGIAAWLVQGAGCLVWRWSGWCGPAAGLAAGMELQV